MCLSASVFAMNCISPSRARKCAVSLSHTYTHTHRHTVSLFLFLCLSGCVYYYYFICPVIYMYLHTSFELDDSVLRSGVECMLACLQTYMNTWCASHSALLLRSDVLVVGDGPE
jgi:hypothetical protein